METRGLTAQVFKGSALAVGIMLLRYVVAPTIPIGPAPLMLLCPLIATLWWGLPAGTAAMIVSVALTAATMMPLPPDELMILSVYTLVGIAIMLVAYAYRKSADEKIKVNKEQAAALVEQQRLLSKELVHRINNTLTLVQAMAKDIWGKTPETSLFEDRLINLGRAHLLMFRSETESMSQLCEIALGPFDRSRFTVSGPLAELTAERVTGLSLIIHELATNAIKYGSLSVEGGSVQISWTTNPFKLRWKELGGPPVLQPERTGFGSNLLHSTANNLGGKARRSFEPDGLLFEVEYALA